VTRATAAPGSIRERVASARSAYDRAVDELEAALGPGWTRGSTSPGDAAWLHFRKHGVVVPRQGWKLHVSATPDSVVALVRDVLPALADRQVFFKMPADLAGVVSLTSGGAGPSQLGKVVTVYPADDDELRMTVELLDTAWRPVHAPQPPHELPVGTGGALTMRFGVFLGSEVLVEPTGRPHSALRGPTGALEPDRRDATPAWAPAPPLPPTPRPSTAPDRVFDISGRRFAALRPLASRAGAAVYAAFDTRSLDVVLVRVASPGVGADELGHDAAARLDNEARVLRHLAGARGTPVVLAHDPERHLLVTGDVGGRSMEHLDLEDRLSALAGAAADLQGLHDLGVVHRDVKPPNVLFDGSRAHLVDFELAALAGDDDLLVGGTVAYQPAGAQYANPDPATDVYALGSCLTYALLGSDPARLPRSDNRERQLSLLRLRGHETGAALVERLTAPEPATPTAAEAAELLAVGAGAMRAEAARGAPPPPVDAGWAREAARSAGLATRAFRVPHRHGHHWRNAHHFAAYAMESVNVGAAGVVLGLCTLDAALGSDEFADDVMGGARWLASRAPYPRAHGLFTGNAGVALALAVAARRHQQRDLTAAARERFRAATAGPLASADLFSGTAGVVLAALSLADVLDQEWPLELVRDAVPTLLAPARAGDGGLIGWPEGSADEGPTLYGAAHGSAGVALALASWGLRTGDREATALAVDVFSGLHERALASDGDFLADSTGRVSPVSMWCHGLTGLSWCLEQVAADLPVLADARAWAAGRVVAAGPALGDPTMCHGTSGSLETFRLIGSTAASDDAAAVLRIVQQSVPGGLGWSSEDPSVATPDLWVGLLGPATQLALLERGSRDALVSPSWLRDCVG